MSSRKTPRPDRFADLPPITDFESCQRVRPLLLHRFGDSLGVWRFCPTKICRRRKSCRRGDATCVTIFMGAMPDEFRRQIRYALQNQSAGFSPREAMDLARARVEDEIARLGR